MGLKQRGCPTFGIKKKINKTNNKLQNRQLLLLIKNMVYLLSNNFRIDGPGLPGQYSQVFFSFEP